MSRTIFHATVAIAISTMGCQSSSSSSNADGAMSAPDGSIDASVSDASNMDLGGDAAMNGLTTVRVHYPAQGHTLSIRGDGLPLTWTAGTSMTPMGDDTYAYTITLPSSVASLQCKPLLDDATWSLGPNYVVQNGQTVDIYPHFTTQAGTVKQLFPAFHSATLNNDRIVWAYLPPSYNENTRATFPVVYMQDGQNLFNVEPNLGSSGWRIDQTLDAAAMDGSIRELIVIGPECAAGNGREYEYTPTVDPSEGMGGGGDLYLTMLITELKPQVDAMLRTQPGRTTTGIMGSSLGGLISIYAGTKKADTFGLMGALSPSTWWDNDLSVTLVKANPMPRPDRVYLDCGDTDDGEEDTDLLSAAYLGDGYDKGSNYDYVVQPGGQHSESYWAMRVPGAFTFLFGARTP